MNTSYNYQTFYKGTPVDLEEAQVIYLLHSSDFPEVDISLKTIKDLSKLIFNNPERPVKHSSEKNEGVWTLSFTKEDKFSFDTILYCSEGIKNSTYSPIVGYTIFSEPQRCYSSSGISFGNLLISVTFLKASGGESLVTLSPDFSSVSGEMSLNDNLPGGYNYLNNPLPPEERYLRYTNRINDFREDSTLGIITDSGIVYHGKSNPEYHGLYVFSGVDVDEETFPTLRIGIYKGDLVIIKLSLKTGEYCVSSLTKLNSFGRPYDYLSGLIENIPQTLLDVTSGAALFEDSNDYVLYVFGENVKERYPKKDSTTEFPNYIVLDRFDPEGKIRYMSFSDIINEVRGTCIYPNNFQKSPNDDFPYLYLEKLGDWWVFRRNEKYYYISPYGYLESSEKVYFLNSRIILTIQEKNGGELYYNFCPVEFRHVYKYPIDNKIKDLTERSWGRSIKASTPRSKLSSIDKCLLDGIRHKPLRSLNSLPMSRPIDTGFGMMFYIDSGLLYCY